MGNFYVYALGQWLVRILPAKAAYAFAVLISDIHYAFSKADRAAVRANLTAITGKDVPDEMVRAVFRNFGRYLADFFTLTKKLTPAYIKDHVECVRMELLDEVLKKGKGGIIISAHIGNWEMASCVISAAGHPLSIIALPHKDPRVNAFFNRQREFFGTTVFPTTTAVRRCLEQLRKNRLVALLVDRDFGASGVSVDFLGRKAVIPKGAALFALKTGAPLVPVMLVRKDNGDFQYVFYEPIEPPAVPENGITDGILTAFIGRYLRVIEGMIRQHPDQWLMFREFWHS